ncbi:MAG: hypothetical protein S4CHLAM7_12390 [Chlamydiae bacterium]|nr:hypothetical protein [Chlamydiota bacterium]
MRIYNEDEDRKVNNVIIYLTSEEAQEMKDALDGLITSKKKLNHEHVPDRANDYNREITLCIYDEQNLEGFHPRAIKLIKEDE